MTAKPRTKQILTPFSGARVPSFLCHCQGFIFQGFPHLTLSSQSCFHPGLDRLALYSRGFVAKDRFDNRRYVNLMLPDHESDTVSTVDRLLKLRSFI